MKGVILYIVKLMHKLMENNITKNDLKVLVSFLKTSPVLTQSKKVREFEKKWSKWLGIKYSIFVNSGSSANLLTISVLKYLRKNKNKNEIIVPALTWSSDINSIIFNGFKPVFVDIDLANLSMDIDKVAKKINKKTLAVFVTHAQGFNGINQKLLNLLKKKDVFLIEDVCESHGSMFKGKKLGTFGEISNFSFYYAHHLTTIEGGMICTNNAAIYNIIRSLRSHGLVRELGNQKLENQYKKKYKLLSPDFIFLYPGYNLRNNEIGAVLGINQLKRLNKNIKLRNRNFLFFLKNLNFEKYYTNYNTNGISNYALPIILNNPTLKKRDRLEKILKKKKIEFKRENKRGGNQIRQPYIKKFTKKINFKDFKNVELVHHYGYYIGNYPELSLNKIKKICNILNSL